VAELCHAGARFLEGGGGGSMADLATGELQREPLGEFQRKDYMQSFSLMLHGLPLPVAAANKRWPRRGV
jgi:hypothetical protein